MKMTINKSFSILKQNKNKKSENENITYWLEKLFKQNNFKSKAYLESRTKVSEKATKSNSDISLIRIEEEKGRAEAIKNRANKAEKNRQAVEDMVRNSNRVLLQVSTVFPLDFFPSIIIVEETRITIIKRQLFSSQTHSVDLKNISNVSVDSGILFAQITIVSDTFIENQIAINKLWKKDAVLLRRIIEGMRMFVSHNIDTTEYSVSELLSKLKKLSTSKIVR